MFVLGTLYIFEIQVVSSVYVVSAPLKQNICIYFDIFLSGFVPNRPFGTIKKKLGSITRQRLILATLATMSLKVSSFGKLKSRADYKAFQTSYALVLSVCLSASSICNELMAPVCVYRCA